MNSNEPQIINYYSDFPEYAIIIDNLNEEYDELITNYIRLYDKINQYEQKPIIKNDNINVFFVLLLFMILSGSTFSIRIIGVPTESASRNVFEKPSK